MIKKIIKILILLSLIIVMITPTVFGVVGARGHVSHSSSHSSSKSTSNSKSTVTGVNKYSTPKNFKSKYNSDNIKTEKIVTEPQNYKNYSATNIFQPNFWTMMWAFQCMRNNTQEVTEQDIAKELEERGYSQEEIKEILQEGEQAKETVKSDVKEKETVNRIITYVFIGILVIVVIVFVIFIIKS